MYVCAPAWEGSASLSALGNRYVYGNGLGAWRRGGLGQDSIDLSSGSYQYNPMTGTSTWVASPSEEAGSTPIDLTILGAPGAGGSLISPSGMVTVAPTSSTVQPSTLSSWLSQNAVMVALALAAGTLLIMAVK